MSNYDTSVLSDLHKEVYGFRPTFDFWAHWETAAETTRKQVWDHLLESHAREMDRYHAEERDAAQRWEDSIAATMQAGAGDRATAIRWLLQAEDADDLMYGFDWVSYKFNLKWGHPDREVIETTCKEIVNG